MFLKIIYAQLCVMSEVIRRSSMLMAWTLFELSFVPVPKCGQGREFISDWRKNFPFFCLTFLKIEYLYQKNYITFVFSRKKKENYSKYCLFPPLVKPF